MRNARRTNKLAGNAMSKALTRLISFKARFQHAFEIVNGIIKFAKVSVQFVVNDPRYIWVI